MSNERWSFDLVHSSVDFWVHHLMIAKVHGRFGRWTGSLEFDERHAATSRVEIQIDAASIDTRDAPRDTHLRSSDFLDAEKHPRITFRSTRTDASGNGAYRVRGDLTIRGTTKPIVLDVLYAGRAKDPWGNERAGFTAKTSINRRDFGLTRNKAIEAGGLMVGEMVEVGVEIEAVKAKA